LKSAKNEHQSTSIFSVDSEQIGKSRQLNTVRTENSPPAVKKNFSSLLTN